MANDKVQVVFEALIGSTTKSTFNTLTKGFKNFAKGLKDSAKELQKMGQVDAASAVGHVAMQMDRLTGSMATMGKGATGTKKKLQDLESGFKSLLDAEGKNADAAKEVIAAYQKGKMSFKSATAELNRLNMAAKIAAQTEYYLANETDLVNAKWKQLIPTIKSGATSFTQAVGRTNNFGKAIQNLRIAVHEGGGSLADFEKGIKDLKVADVKAANSVQLVGTSFKFLTDEGYKVLGITKKNAEAIRKHTQAYTTYEKILNLVGSKQTELRTALIRAGNLYKNNQMRADNYATSLYATEKALIALNGGLMQNANVSSTALKNVNRLQVATQLEAKNLKLVGNTFKVVNHEGLKPFGNLTFEAAGQLKMLGARFEVLLAKEKQLSILTKQSAADIRLQTEAMWKSGKSLDQINRAHQEHIRTLSTSAAKQQSMLQAAVNLTVQYKSMLNPLNALNESQKRSQKRMTTWIEALKRGTGNLRTLTIAVQQEAKSFKAETAAVKAAEKAHAEAQKKARNLALTYSELLKATTGLTEVQKINQTQIRGWIKDIARGKGDVQLLSTAIRKAAKSFNDEAIAVKKADAAHIKNVDSARNLARDYSTLTHATTGTSKAQDILRAKAVSLIREVKNGNATFSSAKSKLRAYAKEFENAMPKVALFEQAISKLGRSLKTYASYTISSRVIMSLTSAFGAGTQAVIDHDQALHNLIAIMNATDTEARLLDKTMMAVTKKTKFGVDEVGAAMTRFAQAGFSASEATAGMADIASLATGTLESLEETVNLVATGVRVFQLEMDQTGLVADVFANAVNNSRLTLHKLNIAFNYIGPLAHAAGLSLKDTTAALELLANAGVRASTTGTGFRRVLSGLLKPTQAFSAAVENAGYEIADFNPLTNDFSDIITKLPDVVGNAGDAIEMFGLRGSSVISAFATQGAAEFNRLRMGLDSVGSASKMADEQMKGLGNMLKNVKDLFGALAVELVRGGVLTGFKTFINLLRGALRASIEFVKDGTVRLGISLASLAGTFLILANSIRALMKLGLAKFFIDTNIALVNMLANFLKARGIIAATTVEATTASGAFALLKTSVSGATKAILVFNATGIGKVITGVVVALTGVITAFSQYEKRLKATQEEQTALSGNISTTLDSFKSYNLMVEKHGRSSKEATEAAKTLRYSAEKLGKQNKEVKKTTDELIESIDEETGAIISSYDEFERTAELLNTEYIDALIKAGNASVALYEKTRFFEPLKKTISDLGKTFIHSLMTPVRLAKLAFNSLTTGTVWLTKKLWDLIGVIPGMGKAAEAAKKKLDELDDSLKYGINSTEEAEKAWTNLQKKMEDGTATEAEIARFEELSRTAKLLAQDIHKSGLSVEDYVKKQETIDPTLLMLVKKEFAAITKEAEKATAKERRFGFVITELEKDIAAANEKGSASIKELSEIFSAHVALVSSVAKSLYAAETQHWQSMAGDYAKYKDSQEEADAMYLERLKLLYSEMHNSYVEVLKKQKNVLMEQYSLELEYLDDYFDNRVSAFEDGYTKEEELAETALQTRLNAIDQGYLSELSKERAAWSAKQQFFTDYIQRAEEHTQKLIALTDERYEAEETKAQLLIDDTEDLNKKIVDLNHDRLNKQKGYLNNLRSKYLSNINSLKSAEEGLTGKIKSELEARESFSKGIETQIRELKWSTLTDTEQLEKKKNYAVKLATEARMSSYTGEVEKTKDGITAAKDAFLDYAHDLDKEDPQYELKAREVTIALKKLDEAWKAVSRQQVESYKDQQRDLQGHVDVFQEQIKGVDDQLALLNEKKVKIGEHVDMAGAIDSLQEFETAFNTAVEDREAAIKFIDSIDKLPVKEQINMISVEMDKEFQKQRTTDINFTSGTSDLSSKITAFNEQLNNAFRDRVVNVTIKKKTVSSGGSDDSGGEENLATGGELDGYGGGDIIPANLEPGEFVMRKESVRKYGADLMHQLNQGALNSIEPLKPRKGYAYGGPVTKENEDDPIQNLTWKEEETIMAQKGYDKQYGVWKDNKGGTVDPNKVLTRKDENLLYPTEASSNQVVAYASNNEGRTVETYDDNYKEQIQFRKEPEEILQDFWSLINDNVDKMKADIVNANNIGDASPYIFSPGTGSFDRTWMTSGSERPEPDAADDLLSKYFDAARAFNSQIGYHGSTFSYEPVLSKKLKDYLDLFDYNDFWGYQGLFEEDALEKIPAKMSKKFAEGGEAQKSMIGSFLQNMRDTIPAMLEPGEFVMKKASVQKYGTGLMQALNDGLLGSIPGFSSGGFIGSLNPAPATGSAGSAGSVTTGERHEVVLNIGGGKYTLNGDSQNVNGFLQAIKRAKGAV